MKKLIVLMLSLAILAALPACVMPNEAFVASVDNSWTVIGPEYVALVEASPTIDATGKRIRTQHAQSLTDLIDAAKGGD